jgi:uncharacterized DUF497 family protein
MQFDWDDDKRQANLDKHGVDFLYAARIFRGPVLTEIDGRTDYGEVRCVAVGRVGEECFVVVFTQRGDTCRLISARKGGRRDRRKYQDSDAGRDRGDA